MWEFLKSKARKELEKLEAEKAKQMEAIKKLEEERIYALYEIEYNRLNKKLNLGIDKYNKKEKNRLKMANETCPKCKSNKVVDKISQIKGEINGSSYSSGSYGLFGGGSYGNGYIHGKIDTLEINKCNDCSNEWKKVTFNQYGVPNWEEVFRVLRYVTKYLTGTEYVKEPAYFKEVKEFWGGTYLEVMPLLIKKKYLSYMSLYDDDFRKTELIELFEDKNNESILIDKLGFIK